MNRTPIDVLTFLSNLSATDPVIIGLVLILAFYKKEISDDFEDMKESVEKEIDNRLGHQDQKLENTSNFVKSSQTTSRILGKDAEIGKCAGGPAFFCVNNPKAGVGTNSDAFASLKDTGIASSEVEEDTTNK